MVVPDSVNTYCKRLPISEGQLHILCPAGIGDVAFTWSKFWSVADKRPCTFWLPSEEQHRADGFFQMVGARYGWMPGLSTNGVWALPGNPDIPDVGGVINVHANRHLDNGLRIEKFYPELPFKNPCPHPNTAVYTNEVGNSNYVVAFMCHSGYMMGNLMPGMWGRLFRKIEEEIAPVLMVGADRDVPFVREVCEIFNPTMVPVLNAPLDQVLSIIKNGKGFVGVASGLSILSQYAQVPTFHLYPRHLAQQPGTWNDSPMSWMFVDEAPYREGEIVERIGKRSLGDGGCDLADTLSEIYSQKVPNGVSGNGMAPDLSRFPVDTGTTAVKG